MAPAHMQKQSLTATAPSATRVSNRSYIVNHRTPVTLPPTTPSATRVSNPSYIVNHRAPVTLPVASTATTPSATRVSNPSYIVNHRAPVTLPPASTATTPSATRVSNPSYIVNHRAPVTLPPASTLLRQAPPPPPPTSRYALPPTDDPNALLREIFSRPSHAQPARDPSRAPILVQDYTSSPTPLAWRSESRAAVVDYQYTNERNPRWMCPSCDFKDYDAHIVAEHRAGTHAKSSEALVMVRYFFVD